MTIRQFTAENLRVMKAAFHDELEKISGEMQGFTRIGRKPISIEKMLEKEEGQPSPSESFASPDVTKTSGTKTVLGLTGLAAGAGGYHVIRKANEDRKMGQMMRLQQGQ